MKNQFSRVTPSTNIWIDGLIDGYQWSRENAEESLELTYKLHQESEANYGYIESMGSFRSYDMIEEEVHTFKDALMHIESVSSLIFTEVKGDKKADLNFFITGRSVSLNRSGFAYAPNPKYGSISGTIGLNREFHRRGGVELISTVQLGSFYGISFLHELAHALGLKHPHDRGLHGEPRFPGIGNKSYNYLQPGDFAMNSHPNTIMTYQLNIADFEKLERKRDFGYLNTLGSVDTATLQWIYGANLNHKPGNDTYKLPNQNSPGIGWSLLWDTGGKDTITAQHSREPATINLNNASLKQSKSAGGPKSFLNSVSGGFVIAHDWDGVNLNSRAGICIIENATGGAGNDSLIGNRFNNSLRGKQGNDSLSGGNGADTLIGGPGRDTLRGGRGPDTFLLDEEIDKLMDLSFREGDRIIIKGKDQSITKQTQITKVATINQWKDMSTNNQSKVLFAEDTNLLYLPILNSEGLVMSFKPIAEIS